MFRENHAQGGQRMQAGAQRRAADTDASGENALGGQAIARAQAPALDQSPHKGNHLFAAALYIPPHSHDPRLSHDLK
jgi:hypothetical protein